MDNLMLFYPLIVLLFFIFFDVRNRKKRPAPPPMRQRGLQGLPWWRLRQARPSQLPWRGHRQRALHRTKGRGSGQTGREAFS